MLRKNIYMLYNTSKLKKNIKTYYKKFYINEKEKRRKAEKDLEKCRNEIEVLKKKLKEIEKCKKTVEENTTEIKKLPKGSMCSISGNNYEKKIYDICKKCNINDKPFNTQNEKDLAGCSNNNDIECDYIKKRDIGIEIKKSKSPDWMQCSIKYNNNTKKWVKWKRHGRMDEMMKSSCEDV
jgi:hypothetical protein